MSQIILQKDLNPSLLPMYERLGVTPAIGTGVGLNAPLFTKNRIGKQVQTQDKSAYVSFSR